MRDKKAAGDDDVPGDVLKLLGEDGFKLTTTIINNICDTGDLPRDFIDVKMVVLKKKSKATKCNDCRTISLTAHTAKIVARILRRMIGKNVEDILGEDSSDLEEEQELGLQFEC
jgi:hypothetical protein